MVTSEQTTRRRALGGVVAAVGGSMGLAAFPLLAGLPSINDVALFSIGVGLAILTAAGAIVAVFSLRRA